MPSIDPLSLVPSQGVFAIVALDLKRPGIGTFLNKMNPSIVNRLAIFFIPKKIIFCMASKSSLENPYRILLLKDKKIVRLINLFKIRKFKKYFVSTTGDVTIIGENMPVLGNYPVIDLDILLKLKNIYNKGNLIFINNLNFQLDNYLKRIEKKAHYTFFASSRAPQLIYGHLAGKSNVRLVCGIITFEYSNLQNLVSAKKDIWFFSKILQRFITARKCQYKDSIIIRNNQLELNFKIYY
jgi:hypothetical protein